ncbi:MAG: hypothetical protein IJU55_01130 [Selenomonadaceae bacterium]|nr:hypothetical protein [Selenomonadaceae bacterium]
MLENQTEEITYSNMPPIKTEYANKSGENFTLEEWAYFMDEVNKQIGEGVKEIDFGKATRNARYLAKLDRSFKNMENGGGRVITDDELRRMIYGTETF